MKIVLVEPPGRLISIHTLREEGDLPFPAGFAPTFHISIHALREEGDGRVVNLQNIALEFLSTPSARRATWSGSG